MPKNMHIYYQQAKHLLPVSLPAQYDLNLRLALHFVSHTHALKGTSLHSPNHLSAHLGLRPPILLAATKLSALHECNVGFVPCRQEEYELVCSTSTGGFKQTCNRRTLSYTIPLKTDTSYIILTFINDVFSPKCIYEDVLKMQHNV